MTPRKPLRKPNLKEFVEEVLDRLYEMEPEDLEKIATLAEQLLLDNDVDEDGNYIH